MKISEIDVTALNNAHKNQKIILMDSLGFTALRVSWEDDAEFFSDRLRLNGVLWNYEATDISTVHVVFRTVHLQ